MLWSLTDNDNHDTNILTSFAFNENKKKWEETKNKHEHWTNQNGIWIIVQNRRLIMKTAVVKHHIATEMKTSFTFYSEFLWQLASHFTLNFSLVLHVFFSSVYSGFSITSKWLTMPISISVTFSNAKLHADKMNVIWTFVNRMKKNIRNFSDPNDNSVNNQF